MPAMKIRIYGDPVLKLKAEEVSQVDPQLKELADSMADTMYEASGIGLAAPQVGVSKRMVVVDVDYASEEREKGSTRKPSGNVRNLRVYVNPVITWESNDDAPMDEGCLSIPGVEGEVYRPTKVRVKYQDLTGEQHEEQMEDLLGRCIQHEIDHLDGILFPDRMPFLKRARIAGQLNKLKREQEG